MKKTKLFQFQEDYLSNYEQIQGGWRDARHSLRDWSEGFSPSLFGLFNFSPALAFFVSLLVQRWARGLQTQHTFRHHVALNLI